MQQAKLFQDGQSQADRLPKEFRFKGESVAIKRVGKAFLCIYRTMSRGYPSGVPLHVFFRLHG